MNVDHLQTLRARLQRRVCRLNSGVALYFHDTFKQFWGFIQSNDLLRGILDDLASRCPEARGLADRIMLQKQQVHGDSEEEQVAISYFVLKTCAESDDRGIEQRVSSVFARGGTIEEDIDKFRKIFLAPFYEYLDEHLDDERAILWLLRRYKHKCEWFHRSVLHGLWKADTRKGEAKLKAHLFEYLHDQGMDFFIEPKSASGEVDLISDQVGEDRLIAEVKVFNPPSAAKAHVGAGFNQCYSYTGDYNRPFGYLVVYNVSPTDLRFTVSHQEQSTPFVVHNGKTIFLLTIGICPDQPSASKRGILKAVEISETDLVDILTQAASAETDDRGDA